MQVALSVPEDALWLRQYGLQHMRQAFWGLSIAVVFLWLVVWSLFLGMSCKDACNLETSKRILT
jgi:hypothetical protein